MPANSVNHIVSAWTVEGREREFKTSLGDTILIRNLEFDDIIDLGIMDELDSLSSIVQEDHLDRVAGKKATKKQIQAAEENDRKKMIEMFRDKEKAAKIRDVLDKVITRCVVAPVILDPYVLDPNDSTKDNPEGRRKLMKNERNPKACYSDYVGLQDKMRIFGEVFQGMEDLEKFREESEADLEPVAAKSVDGNNSR